MNVGPGVGLICGGGTLGLLVAFGPLRRLRSRVSAVVLGAAGVAVGAGALLVQDEASAAEWTITLVALGVLTPVHGRLVFGRSEPTS